MNQKIHLVSSQIGQKILSSSRIPCFGLKNSILTKKQNGLEWLGGPARGYVVPGPGCGAGKGGGAGGSVRESGGALGQYGAAHEEEFFYNKQREQLEKIKTKLKKEEGKSPKITRKDEGQEHNEYLRRRASTGASRMTGAAWGQYLFEL